MGAWSQRDAFPAAPRLGVTARQRLREGLIWLSARDREARELCGDSANDHASIVGGTVAGSTALAFLSGTFYAGHVLHLPWVLAVPVATTWALIIMNLERYVLSSMRRQATWQRTLLQAAPRLSLSALGALVIVHALILGMFAKEIAAQVQRDQTAAYKSDTTHARNAFPQIPTLEQDIKSVQSRLSSAGPGDILTSDPYYHFVAQRYGRLHGLATSVNDRAQRASYAAQAAQELTILLEQRHQLLSQANETRKSLEQRLGQDREELTPLLVKESHREEGFKSTDSGPGGLALQARALGELVSSNSWIRETYILLSLLLLSVDFLPAMQRTLSLLGPPGPYDATLDEIERTTIEINRRRLEDRRRNAFEECEHELRNEQQRRADEDARRSRMYAAYAEQQGALDDEYVRIFFEKFAERTRDWAERDALREIAEIDEWYRRQSPDR